MLQRQNSYIYQEEPEEDSLPLEGKKTCTRKVYKEGVYTLSEKKELQKEIVN